MKNNPKQLAARLGIYLVGLIVLAFGITLSVNSNLGVSPVTSLPYVVSQVLNVTLGTCTIIVYTCYIFLQMILKGGKFQPALLLQLVFSTVFGYLVDGTKLILGNFIPSTYFGQLAMLAASIVLIGFSLVLYIDVKLTPMPAEGLIACIADKIHRPFPRIKTIFDCTCVLVSALLCLVFLGQVTGIREGTVITAMVTGKLIALFRKFLSPTVKRICFGE
jgi:uncharacterized membrane protein YczE